MVQRFFRAKALRFGANGGDARGYRNPLEGAVVGTLAEFWLWVKTLDLLGLDGGDALHRYPLGGVVMEVRLPSGMFCCLRWQVWLSMCFFCLYLWSDL